VTILRFSFFILTGLVILYGGHYFLYRSFVGLFGIARPPLRNALFVLLFLLSTGFIIASAVAHTSHSLAARLFYIGTASWLALAINLILAVCLLRLLIGLAGVAKLDLQIPCLSLAVVILALIFSAYGFWNARFLQIKDMDVTIRNLPSSWKGKTIVQLSDVHLGHIYGRGFLQRLVSQVNALHPELILITGDLFDGMDGDLDALIAPLKGLRTARGVFFITGNHETYLGLDRALAVVRQTHIRILDNEAVNLEGLQIVGLSYPVRRTSGGAMGKLANATALITGLADFDKTKPSILMYHAPVNLDQARAAGINLQLSGHTHKGQIWPFGYFTRLIYGKYHYGLHAIGNFQIYTTNGVGSWGPPMRTSNTPEIPVFTLR